MEIRTFFRGHFHIALLACVLITPVGVYGQSVTAQGDVAPFPDPNPLLGNWDVGGSLIVGNTNTGSLLVEENASVTSVGGRIGNEAGSEGSVTISNAYWGVSSDLYVGLRGSGRITNAGGVMESIDASIAHAAGSTGNVTIQQDGTWNNSGVLYVGKGGTGSLTVEAGGQVQTKTLYTAMGSLSGNGVIQAKGAVLDFSGFMETLYFDAYHGTNQTLAFGGTGQLQLSMDGTGALGVGYRGTGQMKISDGVKVDSSSGMLGLLAGSYGEATLNGNGSEWNTGLLQVGQEGRGVLKITGGGKVSSEWAGINNSDENVPSIVNVLSTGSLWINTYQLNVGESGRAFMQVDYGGRVESGSGILGVTTGGYGEVLVGSGGSAWTMSGDLTVGAAGTGELDIESGGTVSSVNGIIGGVAGGNGTVVVTGVGSHWTNSAAIYVGDKGLGELDVYDGGSVSSSFGAIGEGTNSLGVAVVSGSGSTWSNTYWLSVGENGDASLSVANGGQVMSTGGLIGNSTGGNGTVLVTGTNSSWSNAGKILVGQNGVGSLTVADGGSVSTTGTLTAYSDGDRITLDGGTITADGGVFILADATLGGSGTINGNLSFASDAKLQFNLNGVIVVQGEVNMDTSFGIASLLGLDSSVDEGSYTLLTSTKTSFGDLGIQNWGFDNRYQISGQGDPYKAAYFSEGSLVVNVVPEPSTYALLLVGLGACFFVGVRKHCSTKREGCSRSLS